MVQTSKIIGTRLAITGLISAGVVLLKNILQLINIVVLYLSTKYLLVKKKITNLYMLKLLILNVLVFSTLYMWELTLIKIKRKLDELSNYVPNKKRKTEEFEESNVLDEDFGDQDNNSSNDEENNNENEENNNSSDPNNENNKNDDKDSKENNKDSYDNEEDLEYNAEDELSDVDEGNNNNNDSSSDEDSENNENNNNTNNNNNNNTNNNNNNNDDGYDSEDDEDNPTGAGWYVNEVTRRITRYQTAESEGNTDLMNRARHEIYLIRRQLNEVVSTLEDNDVGPESNETRKHRGQLIAIDELLGVTDGLQTVSSSNSELELSFIAEMPSIFDDSE